MANYLDTGDTGRAVSAESDGALLAGIFGSAKYVLENGSQFKTEVQSNNIVKISDGDAVMYGRHVRIPANDSALVTINNGHSGVNRIDLIVFRYAKDSTGKETAELHVIQGESSSGTAAVPESVNGNILKGALQADFPLYSVELKGVNIVAVEPMFKKLKNMDDLLDEVASKIGNTANLIELLTSNAKVVQDCLTQTGESGIYKWYDATNQPCTGGYILVFKYNDQMSFRIAIGNSGIYASMYLNGTNYGSWVKICTYS